MIETTTKKSHTKSNNEVEEFKDDALAPKGRTKHTVETDWPTKEAASNHKKRKVKKVAASRLP